MLPTNVLLASMLILFVIVYCCNVVCSETTPYQCPAGYPPGECHLTHMGLTSLPKHLPPYTTKLHAEDNAIKELPNGAFQNMHLLIEIYLENNLMSEMTKFMLYGAAKLEHINLANNVINSIHDKAFCETKKLKYLDLQYNCLEQFRPAIFNCTKNLSTLRLNNNWLISLQAPAGYYHSFWMMSLSGNPFRCTMEMMWLQDRRLIGYTRDSEGKEQTPQCRNYPDVSFYDINLNQIWNVKGKVVIVKTTPTEPTDDRNVDDEKEEESPNPVQTDSSPNLSAGTSWKMVAIVVIIILVVLLMGIAIYCFFNHRRGSLTYSKNFSRTPTAITTEEQDNKSFTDTDTPKQARIQNSPWSGTNYQDTPA